MNSEDWDRLRPIGCTPAVTQALAALQGDGKPMRITEVHRDCVTLCDGSAEYAASILPALRRALPALAVGDWVLAQRDAHGDLWLLQRMEPLNELTRRNDNGMRQALVANVDTALLVMGLDGDFNLRRLERYLALIAPARLWPVVVLTKADGCADPAERRAAVAARIGARVEVLAVDARAPETREQLAPWLSAGQTLVLLGSSGAGKSTLTNTLLGVPVQATGAVRADDSRGRHSTTARSLHRLAGGACVIDTPGLRALAPDVDAATLAASFEDIAALAALCRFRDCSHADEPGCAVREGVDPDRLANYRKMLRDVQRETMTALERRALVSSWKVRHRAAQQRMKIKRG